MPTHTSLKGVTDATFSLLNDQLECNVASYFDWGLLGVGAFGSVTIPSSGVYGGNQHQLALLKDKNYTVGQVWQGYRQNWIYESGVDYSTQPIQISGVYVNGAFRPLNTPGSSGYKINYPLGQVVFTTALPTTSTVTCEYSYKQVNVTTASSPWFRELQQNSYRVDDGHFQNSGSGAWSIAGQNRLQLPAVVVECSNSRNFKGWELGGGQEVNQDVQLHIISETPYDKNQLSDLISYQNNKKIYLYDKNYMRANGLFPLDRNGSLISGALTYPNLVRPSGDGGAFWRTCRFLRGTVLHKNVSNTLYAATVRFTCEVPMPEL